MTPIKGCDNSHYQVILTKALAQKALADGFEFCFHKATEHSTYVDPEWAASKAGADAAGLPIAGYHLGRNTGGAKEYAHYAGTCPDGPAVLDVEAGPAMSDANSDAWVDAAIADGRQVIVYGIYAQIKRHHAKALLWADALQPVGDAIFTQDGSAGVYGDLDHYHGDAASLAAIFGGGTMDQAEFDKMHAKSHGVAVASLPLVGDAVALTQWVGGTDGNTPSRKAITDKLKATGGVVIPPEGLPVELNGVIGKTT